MDMGEGKTVEEAILTHIPTRKGFWKSREDSNSEDFSHNMNDTTNTNANTTTTNTKTNTNSTINTTPSTSNITTDSTTANNTALCRICKTYYNKTTNNLTSCRYH